MFCAKDVRAPPYAGGNQNASSSTATVLMLRSQVTLTSGWKQKSVQFYILYGYHMYINIQRLTLKVLNF